MCGHGRLGIECTLQSGQFAPFNDNYSWNNATYATIFDETVSELNSYKGGSTQQAASVVSKTGQRCYQMNEDCYAIYGIEVCVKTL